MKCVSLCFCHESLSRLELWMLVCVLPVFLKPCYPQSTETRGPSLAPPLSVGTILLFCLPGTCHYAYNAVRVETRLMQSGGCRLYTVMILFKVKLKQQKFAPFKMHKLFSSCTARLPVSIVLPQHSCSR